MPKPDYDTTLARIAGNIAGHMIEDVRAGGNARACEIVAKSAVAIARAIVAEVKRTKTAENTPVNGTLPPSE